MIIDLLFGAVIGATVGGVLGISYDAWKNRHSCDELADDCIIELNKYAKHRDEIDKRLYKTIADKDAYIQSLIKENKDLKEAIATFNTADFLEVGEDFTEADISFSEVQ